MIKLGNVPEKGEKDKRFPVRTATFYKAIRSLENWQHVKDAPEQIQNDMKEQIMMTATADGFFSVWMTVFSEEPQILLALIESFPGTNRSCYDEYGKAKKMVFCQRSS